MRDAVLICYFLNRPAYSSVGIPNPFMAIVEHHLRNEFHTADGRPDLQIARQPPSQENSVDRADDAPADGFEEMAESCILGEQAGVHFRSLGWVFTSAMRDSQLVK